MSDLVFRLNFIKPCETLEETGWSSVCWSGYPAVYVCVCVCVWVSHPGPVWLRIRLGGGVRTLIAGLCAQSTAGCRQRGWRRETKSTNISANGWQDVCPLSPHAAPSFHPPLTVTASFLCLSAVQTRIKRAAILFANLFHTLVLLQDHCYNWAVFFFFFFFFIFKTA